MLFLQPIWMVTGGHLYLAMYWLVSVDYEIKGYVDQHAVPVNIIMGLFLNMEIDKVRDITIQKPASNRRTSV